MLTLHYRLWKLIPSDIARTTPGKAVGFLLIPFFNIYWVFVSYVGLSQDMNETLRQQGSSYQVSEGWATALCAIVIYFVLLPVLLVIAVSLHEGLVVVLVVSTLIFYLAPIVIIPSFYVSAKNGAIALLKQE
jgi:hypothetical protein